MVMKLDEITLDISTRYLYNIHVIQISTRPMFYDDYEFQYEYNNESYTCDLDEMCEHHYHHMHNNHIQDAYEIDDEYARDSCDYDALAYRHYA